MIKEKIWIDCDWTYKHEKEEKEKERIKGSLNRREFNRRHRARESPAPRRGGLRKPGLASLVQRSSE